MREIAWPWSSVGRVCRDYYIFLPNGGQAIAFNFPALSISSIKGEEPLTSLLSLKI